MAVVIITGASSGIGYESARMLALQGHKVYAGARRVEKMEPLKQAGVVPMALDVTDEDSVRRFVDTVLERERRIDVLVNNAGYGYFGAIENVSLEEARRQLDVNVFGLAALTRAVIPTMRRQGSGRIINTSSVAGRMTLLYGGWYHVSKYSVEAFSDCLRAELQPFGIDVVKIQPGAIGTEWGIIAARHLAESSQGTAYEKTASREAYWMDTIYRTRYMSHPSVVSKAISRAVNSRHPRTRYAIGLGSWSLLFWHAVLPARWWDALVRKLGALPERKA